MVPRITHRGDDCFKSAYRVGLGKHQMAPQPKDLHLTALLNLIAKLVCNPSAFERHLPAGGLDWRGIGNGGGEKVQKERGSLELDVAGWEAQRRED